ncbi:MAG TPA: hypothetical protein VFL15_05955 [Gammaproteobacteria bacterium]|nr:hypothetical protein [Gammaproteobacteria bacterium]
MIPFLDSHWIASADAGHFWAVAIGISLLAIAAFFGIFIFQRRLRVIEDTPRSLVRSAAQGYVELQGRCRLMPGEPIIAPLTQTRCVWWSYSIEERRSDSKGRETWSVLQRGTSDDLFFIDDGSGQCAIDPDRATIYPSAKDVWYGDSPEPLGGPALGTFRVGSQYRYRESRMHEDDPLYALGYFHTQGPAGMGEINEEIRQLLAEWKRDQATLIRRFDTNHDGQIDQQEWEAAREEARREVLATEREAMSRPPINVLSHPPYNRPFILSTQPQKKLVSRFRTYAIGCLVVFFVAGAVAAHMITLRVETMPTPPAATSAP